MDAPFTIAPRSPGGSPSGRHTPPRRTAARPRRLTRSGPSGPTAHDPACLSPARYPAMMRAGPAMVLAEAPRSIPAMDTGSVRAAVSAHRAVDRVALTPCAEAVGVVDGGVAGIVVRDMGAGGRCEAEGRGGQGECGYPTLHALPHYRRRPYQTGRPSMRTSSASVIQSMKPSFEENTRSLPSSPGKCSTFFRI